VRKAIPVGLAVMLLSLPAVSSAQDAQVAQPAATLQPAQTPPPAPAAPVQVAPAQAKRLDAEERRHPIRMMEAVLSRAVLTGAEHLAEQLGSGNPNMSFFTGQARARGFVLDGYGVFFHVEIPEMQQSVVWSVTTVERDAQTARALDTLKGVLDSIPDGSPRLRAEQALKTLQVQVGPMPALADPTAAGARGVIQAATTNTSNVNDTIAPVPPMPILRDPNGAYRDAIKSALIDAMLEHSRGMNIQPDEWLSVAAHRGDSPMAPNEIVTTPTLVLRIKGSDLALYDSDRTRKDEIRKRVEAREF
jgi:hypothetical protein